MGACSATAFSTIIGGCNVCFGGKGWGASEKSVGIVNKNTNFCTGDNQTTIGSAAITMCGQQNFALSTCLATFAAERTVSVASCNATFSDNYATMYGLQNCSTAAQYTYLDAFTKVIGCFTRPHPDPAKKSTHTLSHNFVESPTEGENIYRYQVSTTNCQAIIELPSYYKFLNKNTITKVSPVDTFGTGYAVLDSAMDCVTFTSNCEGKYNILLIGTRKDPDAVRSWCGVEPYRDSNNCSLGREV
jgi:hypothetical protein